MKNAMIYAMSILMVLSLAACGGRAEMVETVVVSETEAEQDTALGGEVQIPNPWQECATAEEAGKLAGVSFTVPETVEGFDETYIAAIPGDVAEVIFSKKEDENAEVMFRKGSGDEDISGDYNTYDDVDDKEIDGKNVTVRSNNGVVYTVTWVQDGFTYAISARAGVSMEQMTQWIQALA